MNENISFSNIFDDILKKWEKEEINDSNYVSFFHTDSIKSDEMINILKNIYQKENYIIFGFINELNKTCCIDGNIFIFDNINNEEIITDVSKNITFYRRFLRCYFAYAIKNEKFNSGGKFNVKLIKNDNINVFLDEQEVDDEVYYRGQSNCQWGLIPSMFRNYRFKSNMKTDGYFVDINMLYENYSESDLIDKYNKTIAIDKIVNASDISYDFIAYMQHSLAYSPLIDVTKKKEIGLQFALGNKYDINNFLGSNSTLFAFKIKNQSEKVRDLKNIKLNVKILNKKIVPGRKMVVEDVNGKHHNLDFTTAKSTIKELRPEFVIINKVYNDRMRYQHGEFILFYDYTMLNDRILFNLNSDIDYTQYIILTISKKGLYELLNKKYPQYNMDYLMAPYDYFKK